MIAKRKVIELTMKDGRLAYATDFDNHRESIPEHRGGLVGIIYAAPDKQTFAILSAKNYVELPKGPYDHLHTNKKSMADILAIDLATLELDISKNSWDIASYAIVEVDIHTSFVETNRITN